MPLITYVGHTPTVSVPTHRLAEVQRGVPVDVPEHVAADLTLAGTSTTWVYADQGDDDETPED